MNSNYFYTKKYSVVELGGDCLAIVDCRIGDAVEDYCILVYVCKAYMCALFSEGR